MSKTIKSLSESFEAFKVPTHAVTEYDGHWLNPGESIEITKEQSEAEDVQSHKAAGRVKVKAGSDSKHKVVENVSSYIVYFAVPGQVYQFSRQYVMAPGGEITLTDEQAASPSVQEFLKSGKADDPDDNLIVRGGSGKMYNTITAAMNAGETEVKLMGNHNRATTIAADKKMTVDLNGFGIKCSGQCFRLSGELEVKGDGNVESTKSYCFYVDNNGKLTIHGGTYNAVEGVVSFVNTVNAEAIINGGEFNSSDNAVLIANGSAQYGSNKCTVNGGVFNGHIKTAGYIACGIYCPNDDVFIVNGGEFNIDGGCGICSRAGNVTVNGGSFTCTGTAEGFVGDSKNKVPSAALVFDSNAKYPNLKPESNILVKGGSFKSDVPCVANIGEERIVVEGGTFDPAL